MRRIFIHNNILKTGLIFLIAISSYGCNFAPNPMKPDVTKLQEMSPIWSEALIPQETIRPEQWWTIFENDELNLLEQKLQTQNFSIASAVARYESAQSQTRQALSGLFPQISLLGNSLRTQHSLNVASPVKPTDSKDRLLEFAASWEIDLWGRQRNLLQVGLSQQRASSADLASLHYSLELELAKNYFALVALDQTVGLLQETLNLAERVKNIGIERQKNGVMTLADSLSLDSYYHKAKSNVSEYRLKRGQLVNSLALLLGESPGTFEMAFQHPSLKVPKIAPVLPSTLLERRPDVVAALQRFYAANAQIGVARAAQFPEFDFISLLGTESSSFENLLKTPSYLWTFGPSMTAPLFDAGRRMAIVDQAESLAQEATENYRQVVLVAIKDVEEALLSERELMLQNNEADNIAVNSNRLLLETRNRYDEGINSVLDLYQAQNNAATQAIIAINTRLLFLNSKLAMLRAIGSDWDMDEKAH